jgi:hypothetical protein
MADRGSQLNFLSSLSDDIILIGKRGGNAEVVGAEWGAFVFDFDSLADTLTVKFLLSPDDDSPAAVSAAVAVSSLPARIVGSGAAVSFEITVDGVRAITGAPDSALIDFVADVDTQQWAAVPVGLPHYDNVSPEDPLAPNFTNYVQAAAVSEADRVEPETVPATVNTITEYRHQFAYNGVAIDIVPGVRWRLAKFGPFELIADEVVNMDSDGVNKAGQVDFTGLNIAASEWNSSRVFGIVKLTTDGGGVSPPTEPRFEE